MDLYKQIKSLIPNSFKYPVWFVFKAPQRKLSPLSLIRDLKGIAIYLWYRLIPAEKPEPVSICTGIYNRSGNYLNQLLESLNKAKNKDLIELSVFDCASTDVPDLEKAIRDKWNGKLRFTSEPVQFSRAYTFNQAVQQATSNIVFICDADMSVPEEIVTLCNQFTAPKRVWYPIFFFLYKNKPARAVAGNGEWEQYGSKGMLAVLKDDYLRIGGLDEQYKVWGYEDTDLWNRFHQNGYTIIRNRQTGLFHHWHDSFNPKYQHMNSVHE